MTHSWPAPAKLNLFLHVTGRRPDGYHLLQTVFQFLDFADELTFETTPDGAIRRLDPVADIPEASDLCVRAARLLQETAGTLQGAAIRLVKRIPVGGGLGGGSSDAATTLLALNRLWGLDWPLDRLAELGLRLGADVPVFVRGHAAWAEGVGEVLTPIDPPEDWFVVLVPPVHVSTARIFSAFSGDKASETGGNGGPGRELTPFSPPITIRDFRAGAAHNDLEPIVRTHYPEVNQALDWLSQYGETRMTGSGACIFLRVASEEAGQAVLTALAHQGPRSLTGFVAQGTNVHPIHARLGLRANWTKR